jgi:short-subunit dehydrogenase
MKDLTAKRVFITGGAMGIGRELALALADERCELLLSDINQEQLEKTAKDIVARGARCSTYVLDVTDTEAIARVKEAVEKEAGGIDVLVNNAGIVFGGAFLDVPLEKHLATYRVNVEGLVAMTHLFLPLLIARSDAHLVNIASASGFIALPNGSTYASSKWAAIGFSESIRVELKRTGNRHVKVTTVCPSYVATGMFDGANPPKTTGMLDPVDLSRKIIKAVKRDREFVLEPWLIKVTPISKWLFPVKVADLITDLFGASGSMEQWHGHGKDS